MLLRKGKFVIADVVGAEVNKKLRDIRCAQRVVYKSKKIPSEELLESYFCRIALPEKCSKT